MFTVTPKHYADSSATHTTLRKIEKAVTLQTKLEVIECHEHGGGPKKIMKDLGPSSNHGRLLHLQPPIPLPSPTDFLPLSTSGGQQ
ncbi:hypothetical protein Hamer_G002801 [Homarus americanus]|uniref:Uncharacterized protein n=1 Tax=Homarus americanus TaxID=6706 RepID=A0A8J5JSU0_HOMAM|nr:hypothetical protein Hamer_G002801 [Homarus americanus]